MVYHRGIIGKRHKYVWIPTQSKMTPELIYHLNEWIGNHPKMVNSPISNDTLLVPDQERPGKKIRVSKLILQISILEIHNDLIFEIRIYKLEEAIDETTEKPLISDKYLRALIPKNVRKTIDRYKQMCGCKICVIICYKDDHQEEDE